MPHSQDNDPEATLVDKILAVALPPLGIILGLIHCRTTRGKTMMVFALVGVIAHVYLRVLLVLFGWPWRL